MRWREVRGPVGRLPTGSRNAITDVPGVRVGHSQAASGQRTGVTVVEPPTLPAPAGAAVVNGIGELTGKLEIDERGELTTPVYLCGTHALGVVYQAAVLASGRGPTTRSSPWSASATTATWPTRAWSRSVTWTRRSRRSIRSSTRAASARAPAWPASTTPAASAPPRAGSASTTSASCCCATSATAPTSTRPASSSSRRRHRRRARAPASPSARPTRRCRRSSCAASRSGRCWGWRASAPMAPTAPGRSAWRFRPRATRICPRGASIPTSPPPTSPRTRRSTTAWWPRSRRDGSTGRCRTPSRSSATSLDRGCFVGMARLVLILTTLAMLVAATSAQATYPGRNGGIAYTVSAGSGEGSPITSSGGLAFRRTSGDRGASERVLVRCASTDDVPDADCPVTSFSSPTFSPTGKLIAFDAGPRIGLIAASGGAVTLLPGATSDDGDPTFTPDGKRIVFTGANDHGTTDLYVRAIDGTGGARLLLQDAAQPAVSVRGVLAYVRSGNVYLRVPKKGKRRWVTSGIFPDWSPD